MLRTVLNYLFLLIVVLQIIGSVALINQSGLIFAHGYEAHGPLTNNLLFVIVYLTIAETFLLLTRYVREGSGEILMMGTILILTMLGMEFYASLNSIALNGDVLVLGMLFGLCHIGYGLYVTRAGEKQPVNHHH